MRTLRSIVLLLSVGLALWLMVLWATPPSGQGSSPDDTAASAQLADDVPRTERERTPRVPAADPDDASPEAPPIPVQPTVDPAHLVATVVSAFDGAGLPGATVVLHDEQRGVTDQDGVCELREVPRGLVHVRAEADGFVRSDWTFVDTRTAATGAEPATVEIRLVRGGARVGQVVDAVTGLPIAEATVEARSGAGSGIFADPALTSGQTRDDGRFELDGLPAGKTITLLVKAPGHASAQVVVRPDADTPTIELAPAGAVRGSVVLTNGEPVAGADVYAVPDGSDREFEALLAGASWMGRSSAVYAKSGADGTFTLSGLSHDHTWRILARRDGLGRSEPTGHLDPRELPAELRLVVASPARLEVTVAGPDEVDPAVVIVRGGNRTLIRGAAEYVGEFRWSFARLEAGSFDLWVEVPGHLPVSQRVELPPGELTRTTVRLDRGATVTGRTLDADGRPLPGIVVRARSGDVRQRTMSGDDGRFVLPGLPREPVKVSAAHEAFSFRSQTVDAPADDVELVGTQLGRVTLTVAVPDGHSVPRGVNAIVQRYRGPRDAEDGHDDPRTGTKRWTRRIVGLQWDDGRAAVEHLLVGVGRVRVFAQGFAPLHVDYEIEPGGRLDLGVVTLDPGSSVRGRVQDEDGRPLPGAAVHVPQTTTSLAQRTTTDASGEFELAHVGAGRISISARLDGYGMWAHEVDVTSPMPTVVVPMARLRTLTLDLLDAAGNGVADPTFTCTRMDGDRERENHGGARDPDAPGRVVLELLPAVYRLRFGGNERDVDLTGDDVTLTLQAR